MSGGRLTPQAFVATWRGVELSERASAQEHFLDLCALFNHPMPAALSVAFAASAVSGTWRTAPAPTSSPTPSPPPNSAYWPHLRPAQLNRMEQRR